jgi:hypothetical protein
MNVDSSGPSSSTHIYIDAGHGGNRFYINQLRPTIGPSSPRDSRTAF